MTAPHGDLRAHLMAALEETGHSHTLSRATRFAPYLEALLRAGEQVLLIGWARLVAPGSPSGYLVLTDERLLLVDDICYPDSSPGEVDLAAHPLFPRYTFAVIERSAIRHLARVEESGSRPRLVVRFDESGGSLLTGTGEPVVGGEAAFRVGAELVEAFLFALGEHT